MHKLACRFTGQKFKRICPKCNSKNTTSYACLGIEDKKDGKRRGRQSYKCKSCNYVWITKPRKNNNNLAKKLYYLYAMRKQTYSELSQDYWGKLDIPNTTNGLETLFGHLKTKLRCHPGLRLDRKIKFLTFLLNQSYTFYN